MPDRTPNPLTVDPASRSPVDAVAAAGAGLRLQFCRGDDDLTAHPAADTDATEVRLWGGELVLAAVTHDPAEWAYAGGDCGHRIPDEHLHARFSDWRHALHALTGITIPPE
ncbi:hypothetical protein [Nocardia asiatica]|uniref:hypothetical protein n=1 Tax=Nocardia asiatica TaxID=209252 RepID=UPI00030F8260|nr:hypothetical protein [Nocardia asiatica]